MNSIVRDLPEGRLEIESDALGRIKVHVALKNPDLFLPICDYRTAYSTELIETILEAKGLAWLCDEIARDESGYVEKKIRANVDAYLEGNQCQSPHILDFGCGCGASILALARIFPGSKITGIELDEKNAAAARARIQYANVPAAVCLLASEPDRLPQGLGQFDLINLNAVVEHLLPKERSEILKQLWAQLRSGGVMLISETPYRFSLFEHHTTGLPLANFVPGWLLRRWGPHWSRRIEPHTAWPALLRNGIRGSTEKEILRILRKAGYKARRLKPKPGSPLRCGREEWPVSLADFSSACTYDTSSKKAILFCRMLRLLSRYAGLPLAADLSLTIEKK